MYNNRTNQNACNYSKLHSLDHFRNVFADVGISCVHGLRSKDQ